MEGKAALYIKLLGSRHKAHPPLLTTLLQFKDLEKIDLAERDDEEAYGRVEHEDYKTSRSGRALIARPIKRRQFDFVTVVLKGHARK